MEDAVQYVYDYLYDNIPDYEWKFPEEGFLHSNLALGGCAPLRPPARDN